MKILELQNVVWKEGKFYVAQCLDVDISSFGNTKLQALKNLREALELYFEDQPKLKLSRVKNPELIRFSLENA
jgi:predicted RNase H-like HicB family nuclease